MYFEMQSISVMRRFLKIRLFTLIKTMNRLHLKFKIPLNRRIFLKSLVDTIYRCFTQQWFASQEKRLALSHIPLNKQDTNNSHILFLFRLMCPGQ